jgi:hypothetical protein
MRRQFSHPRRKRQTRPLTGRKVVQRHAAWQAGKKAGPWLPWVRPISVYALLNSADSEADSAEPNRPSSPTHRGRWS